MNNLDPLVSVVIPAYNREAFIGEAIRSILQQTFRDLELLVVDDGSTDGTRAVAYRAAREDHRFRFIRRERNGGVSCALNTGFQASRGKFIARLDSDDRATRDRIAAQLHAFSEQERLVAMGSHVFQFGGVPEQLVKFPLSDRDIKAHLITAANHISGGSIMVRRSFIDEHKIRFDERLTVAEDYDYIVSIMEHGGVTINIDAPLIDYRYMERTLQIPAHSNFRRLSRECGSACLQYGTQRFRKKKLIMYWTCFAIGLPRMHRICCVRVAWLTG